MEIKKNNKLLMIITIISVLFIGIIFYILNTAKIDVFRLILHELIIILGFIALVYDVREKKVPNYLILTMLLVWIFTIISKIFLGIEFALDILKDSIIGFVLGGGLFFLVYLFNRNGLGGGDVKFIAIVGLFLGFERTLTAMFYGTLIASFTALSLILFKKIDRKDTIPLIPFLYIGILVTIFYKG